VVRGRSFLFFGPAYWHVRTNAVSMGMNESIEIDDATGQVRRKAFLPR
jgi:hypothetical protein